MCHSDFREHLVIGKHILWPDIQKYSAQTFTDEYRKAIPRMENLFAIWKGLYDEPFVGLTTDGQADPSPYTLSKAGAPADAMTRAAKTLLGVLNDSQRKRISLPLDAAEWRSWHNAEMVIHDHGLRMEILDTAVREAIFGVIRASLSEEGFARLRGGMRTNQFLGDCLGYPNILGEYSYTFALFGTPDVEQPWGWQFFGHHLALNCVVIGEHMVLGPIFYGAEPTAIDEGPHAGLRLFTEEELTGLATMRSLTEAQQAKARLPRTMATAELAPSPARVMEQRHLTGAFRDNRIIPYEGISGRDLDQAQRDALMATVDCYIDWLPDGPRTARREEIELHLDETWFCWIGGTGDSDVFYYRIHSPVVLIEFDHHFAAHLANEEPARFHIHTIARLPNGNDYAKAVIKEHTG